MSFEFYRLANGVRVILVPMTGVESVAVGVYVKTGSRYETKNINGLSHFLEHMAFKGTKKLPTTKDTSKLEGLGAIQNAWADVGATAYWCKIPADRWRDGLEVVKELALYPTFPASDLEIERGVVLEEIRHREDRPDELSAEALQRSLFAQNPLGQTVLGRPEVIRSVSRADFVDYHHRQYVAGRLVVVVAGKIRNSKFEIRNCVQNWFGELPKWSGQDFQPVVEDQKRPQVAVEAKKLANQAHVQLAVRGLTVSDPRRFASAILTTYLGRGLSSKLFEELREKRGLCYAVAADEERWEDTGIWSVYVGTGLRTLMDAVRGVLKQMDRVRQIKLTAKELAAAKEKLRGPLLFSAEDPARQMEFYARQALDRPDLIMAYETLIKRLMQVTAADVQQVARDLFRTEKLTLAVVGPLDKTTQEKLPQLLKL